VKSKLRTTDLLSRFGGDEFFALPSPASAEGATEMLGRLRESIESSMRSLQCEVTASIGAGAYKHASGDLDEVLRAAGQVM